MYTVHHGGGVDRIADKPTSRHCLPPGLHVTDARQPRDFDAAWDPRSLMMDAEHTADEYRHRAAVWSRVGPPATCHCLIMKIGGRTDLAALSRTGGGMDLAALGRTDCTTLRPPPTPPPTPPAPRARVAAIATAGHHH